MGAFGSSGEVRLLLKVAQRGARAEEGAAWDSREVEAKMMLERGGYAVEKKMRGAYVT